MRTERGWSVQLFPLWCAVAVLAQIGLMRSLPYDLTSAGSGVWHTLAFAAIGLLLWVAFDVNRLLFLLKETLCAASSQRSRRATSSRS
jgi:hypothetical protein